MKYSILIIFIIFFYNAFSSDNYNIAPVNLHLKGVAVRSETVIAYGSHGSLLLSRNKALSWEQIKVFDRGNIIFVFIEDDRLIAISNIGEVKLSLNAGIDWIAVADYKDSIVSALAYSGGYYFRSLTRIIKTTKDFKLIKDFPIKYGFFNYNNPDLMLARQSLIIYNNHLIAQNDSSVLIRFDDTLNPIDSLSFKDLGICEYCRSSYQLYSDNKYIYAYSQEAIYRTKDFLTIEKFFDFADNYEIFGDSLTTYVFYFKVVKGRKICINKVIIDHINGPYFDIYEVYGMDSVKKIARSDCSLPYDQSGLHPGYLEFNDFTIKNNMFYLAGDNKFLVQTDIESGISKRVSEMRNVDIFSDKIPDMIDDSTFLFYTHKSIYKTTNSGITFSHIPGDTIFLKKYNNFNIAYKAFDENEKILYVIGHYNSPSDVKVLISKDYGNSFDSLSMENFNLFSSIKSNLSMNNNYFTIAHSGSNNGMMYNWILTYDKDFKFLTMHRDSMFYVYKIFGVDTNSFIIHSFSIDQNFNFVDDIRFTTDRGMSWEIINEYQNTPDGFTSNLLSVNEVKLKKQSYWINFLLSSTDSILTIEALNIETKKIDTIYQLKAYTYNYIPNIAVCNTEDQIYFSIDDTLYFTNDIYNWQNWEHFLLPDNGSIHNVLKKIGNRFFSLYKDDIHPLDLYFIEFGDTITTVIEPIINTYFYSYPPFPIPSNNEVSSKIYWDKRVDIDNSDIGVYNIYGDRLERKENITIQKLNTYSGYLKWDCSSVPSGIYLIRILYGTNTEVIKVVVAR